jgi:hypothetical protein
MKPALRSLIAFMLAALLFVGFTASVPQVGAMEEWCEDDPPVVLTTPAGNQVLVYVTSGALGIQHLPSVQVAQIVTGVQPANGGAATQVTTRVTVLNDVFGSDYPTRTTVS